MTTPALVTTLLLGPCLGSFLATAIERRGAGIGWVTGRSRCDACAATLPAGALIPILSFARQRGRARCCRARISPACTMVEIACLAVPVTAWASGLAAASEAVLIPGCLLGWSLIALALVDLREGRLPDFLTLPLTLAGLAWIGAVGGDLSLHALAALMGYAAIDIINRAYRAVRRRDGLGMGDAKLVMAGGAWCGLVALPGIVLVGCIATLGYALIKARGSQLDRRTALPFGPGLALGIWVSFLAGPLLWDPFAW